MCTLPNKSRAIDVNEPTLPAESTVSMLHVRACADGVFNRMMSRKTEPAITPLRIGESVIIPFHIIIIPLILLSLMILKSTHMDL